MIEEALRKGRARRGLPAPALRRLLRERAGLTQRDVAQLVGASRVAVTCWELGRRNPRGDFLVKYVALLDRLASEAVQAS